MNPVVEAAWIAASVGGLGILGTAVVAIAGARSTRNITALTIKAGTDSAVLAFTAARDDRLWERRASAYEAALTAMLEHVARRHQAMRKDLKEPDQERLLADFFAAYESQDWLQAEARLYAYSSVPVQSAFISSRAAAREAAELFDKLSELRQERAAVRNLPAAERSAQKDYLKELTDQTDQAFAKTNTAMVQSIRQDDALMQLIRAELQVTDALSGEGHRAGSPPTPVAPSRGTRHKSHLRRKGAAARPSLPPGSAPRPEPPSPAPETGR